MRSLSGFGELVMLVDVITQVSLLSVEDRMRELPQLSVICTWEKRKTLQMLLATQESVLIRSVWCQASLSLAEIIMQPRPKVLNELISMGSELDASRR